MRSLNWRVLSKGGGYLKTDRSLTLHFFVNRWRIYKQVFFSPWQHSNDGRAGGATRNQAESETVTKTQSTECNNVHDYCSSQPVNPTCPQRYDKIEPQPPYENVNWSPCSEYEIVEPAVVAQRVCQEVSGSVSGPRPDGHENVSIAGGSASEQEGQNRDDSHAREINGNWRLYWGGWCTG